MNISQKKGSIFKNKDEDQAFQNFSQNFRNSLSFLKENKDTTNDKLEQDVTPREYCQTNGTDKRTISSSSLNDLMNELNIKKVKERKSADSLFINNEKLYTSSLHSVPFKAIECSYKKRKNKNEKSQFSSRRDVIHKAIFRALRRHFSSEFENMHTDAEVTKDNFKDLVQLY